MTFVEFLKSSTVTRPSQVQIKLCQESFTTGEVATADSLSIRCAVCYWIQSHELFLLVGILVYT